MRDREKQRERLLCLSAQEGHYGTIDVEDVLTIMQLRDVKIEELKEILKEVEAEK